MEHDSSIDFLSLCMILLDKIRIKEKENMKIFCKVNGKKYVFLLIQKYIIFIQCFYKSLKIDMMEILNYMTETEIEPEEITQFNTAGLVPLILTYVNNCMINHFLLLEFISKFANNNSMTVINLLEKLNMKLDITAILSEHIENNHFDEEKIIKLKLNIFHMFNFLSFKIIIMNKNSFHIDDLLIAIKNIPIIKRRRKNLNEIMKFIIEICHEISIELVEEQTVNLMMATIMSLLYYKKSIRSGFIHSTCLFHSKSFEYLPEENLNEFIHKCLTCDMKICLICLHRCHIGHNTSPIGYSFYRCDCSLSDNCQATNSLELPTHIRKSYPSIIENRNDESKSSSKYRMNIPSITISDKSSDKTVQILSTPRENIYISTECNTLTIKSDSYICNVTELVKEKDIDNELVFDIFNEDTLYYFEIEIVMGGYYDQIAIGVTTNENYPSNEFAGYLNDSVGYHGDDGKCFVNSNSFTYGTKFGSNDIIGCGVTTYGNVYFTHNGSLLPLLDVKFIGSIYSIISLRGKYCSVKINHYTNSIEINSPIFKHHKQKSYKNPINLINHSNSICNVLITHESFVDLIHKWCMKYKNVVEISSKFLRYSMTMHSNCKIKKRNLIKYLVLSDFRKNDEIERFEYMETNEIQINPEVKVKSDNKIAIDKLNYMIPKSISDENQPNFTYMRNNKEIVHKNEDVCKCGKGKCIII